MLGLLTSKAMIPIIAALAMAAVIGWAYKNGVDSGKRRIISEIEQAREASVERKQEIDNEIRNLDSDALLERALGAVRGGDSG